MSGERHHMIQSFKWDVQVPDKFTSVALYDLLEEYHIDRFSHVLDKICRDLNISDVVFIQTVELDLGDLDFENLLSNLEQKLAKQIEECLVKYTQSPGSSKNLSLVEKVPESPLAFFLQNGVLPWWYNDGNDSSPEVLFNKELNNHDNEFFLRLNLIIKHPHVIERLVSQFNQEVNIKLLAYLYQAKVNETRTFIKDTESLYQSLKIEGSNSKYFLIKSYQNLIQKIRPSIKELWIDDLWENIGNRNLLGGITDQRSRQLLKKQLEEYVSMHPERKRVSEMSAWIQSQFLHQQDVWITSGPPQKKDISIPNNRTELQNDSPIKQAINANNQLSESDNSITKSHPFKHPIEHFIHGIVRDKGNMLSAFFIGNAGIVILWPYLKKFFETLSLTRKGDFVSEEARIRAIHLLQYLVTGEKEPMEHKLVLNKILCGLDPLTPVPRFITIESQELNECEILLKAVISNWSILKNTSANGFRVSFLQREGKIQMDDLGWTLFVESSSIDVLMDHLPWTISFVNWPWMKKTLTIQWTRK